MGVVDTAISFVSIGCERVAGWLLAAPSVSFWAQCRERSRVKEVKSGDQSLNPSARRAIPSQDQFTQSWPSVPRCRSAA